MKTAVLAAFSLAVAALAVGDARADDGGTDGGDSGALPAGPGDAPVPQLACGLAVKEGCSCVFIVKQTDTYCTAYGAPAAYVAVHLQIDHPGNAVTATFLGATRTAHFVDGAGCTLDP